MRKEEGGLFWLSYADLMTSLFIVVLALFVLSFKSFSVKTEEHELTETELLANIQSLADKEAELANMRGEKAAFMATQEAARAKMSAQVSTMRSQLSEESGLSQSLLEHLQFERQRLFVLEEEYKKLKEIQRAIENLDPRYFTYQKAYKRHILKSQVLFAKGDSDIPPAYEATLIKAGSALPRMLSSLKQDENIKYMLVIEGMASRDTYDRNYELSYERALALYRLWQRAGIEFDPNQIEVMISGSGEGGVGRNQQDERLNQRFLIQIMPKIGELRGLNL
ncbi:MAG: OmpA family protein [Bacteroidota bacterium]